MESFEPAIILVEPQLGDNIGATARAMLNCGLMDLRLVAPRDGWPNPRARAMASGADEVLEAARVFETVTDAVADLQKIYATTARHRDMVKPEVTPKHLAAEMRQASVDGVRCGVLFGRERIGLTNDEVVLCDAIVHVPLNPSFSSLNLGQAVLLIAYEWFQAGDATPPRQRVDAGQEPVTAEKLQSFFGRLEAELDAKGFFYPPEKTPATRRTLRNIFQRNHLTDREVQILHGIVSSLLGKHRPRGG